VRNLKEGDDEKRELWRKEKLRLKRKKRASDDSVKSRESATLIGSDTDDEEIDVKAMEAGST
jgi:hypothetical protein